MALHEALVNGLSSALPLNHSSMASGQSVHRSPPKMPQHSGFPIPGLARHDKVLNLRPNILHASGGKGIPFPNPGFASSHQGGMNFSPHSFAEAIRGPSDRFINPLFHQASPTKPGMFDNLFKSHGFEWGDNTPDKNPNIYDQQDHSQGFPSSNNGLHDDVTKGIPHNYDHQNTDQLDNKDPESVTINDVELEAWFSQLRERVVIGLSHGPRPSMDVLKHWIFINWENKNIFPQHIQYLPNNFYLFFFEDANSALQVITEGQWLIKSTPISFFKWFKGFNPKGEKPTKIPVCVDFPDLPVEFFPWLSSIGNVVGKGHQLLTNKEETNNKEPNKKQDQEGLIPPESPLAYHNCSQDSQSEGSLHSSEENEETVHATQQVKEPYDHGMDLFVRELELMDQQKKGELNASSPSADILMSQAEEETLPIFKMPKPKRKVEKSSDPTRSSVVLAKPTKSSKK
ncbi:hypothetical protein L7F22_004754 [Adiantum nelumboides]|nr:hypothetical protein [Adiantum nelumboides]